MRGWSGYQLLIGDVNGDGKADLVWNELGGLNRFYVGLSQGNGKFQFLRRRTEVVYPLEVIWLPCDCTFQFLPAQDRL